MIDCERAVYGTLPALIVLLSAGCSKESGPGETSRFPIEFNHTIGVTSYEYVYSVASIDNGASTQLLTLRVFLPENVEGALPFVIFGNTGSFTVTDSDDTEENRSRILPYIQCGMGAVIVKTRVHQDAPIEPGWESRGATTNMGRAIDAMTFDFFRATKFIQSNPDPGNWVCEPRWVFLGGGSSSGIGTMCAVIRWKDELNIAGMINWITSFGADSAFLGLNYVANVRTELGHTEAQYLDSFPPMCHFSIENDDCLSFTTVPTLQSLLNSRITAKGMIDGKSIVHLDPNSPPRFAWSATGLNHWLAADWNESTLTDADSLAEAVFNFVVTVLAEIEPTPNLLELQE